MRRFAVITFVAAALVACGAPRAELVVERPTTPVEMPQSPSARRQAVAELGRRTWNAMASGHPQQLLYADRDLEALLNAGAVHRIEVRRLASSGLEDVTPAALRRPLARATYAGICLQGARTEPAGGALGLISTAWVVDRVLIIGRRATGGRVAAWVEGVFVYSDAGFAALDLERVEEPRWEHSDLEIAPCDLSIRNDLPEIAQ